LSQHGFFDGGQNGTALDKHSLIFKESCQTVIPSDSLLRRHLGWIIAIKLVALLALWWVFIRDAGVRVDPGAVSRHLAPNPVVQGEPHGQ